MKEHHPRAFESRRSLWRNPALMITFGCLIALITYGIRTSFGLFTEPVSLAHEWSRQVFAFAVALQNLLWGVGQPLAGAMADRFGTARVLALGGVVYALGLVLMSVSTTPLTINLSVGVLVGLGLSGASFTIVLAAFARLVPTHRRSWALGLATAAGSLGQFVFAPLGQAFISHYGWAMASLLLAACVVTVPLLAVVLRGHAESEPVENEPLMPFVQMLRQAFAHGSYLLLLAGFFVCGFHVAFITTHLPAYLNDIGDAAATGAWAIGLIGLFNIIGAYTSGMLGGKFSKRYLLSGIYLGRALAIALFVTLPPNPITILVFAAVMGLLWLSTVPLTSGLVAVMFGTRYMATLFGFVFLSHQVGAFLGAWLGGLFYDRTGSYDAVWWLSVGLGLFAAVIHWPIAERAAPQLIRASA